MATMKYMISQPMNGKSDAEILYEKANIVHKFETMFMIEGELIDSYFPDIPSTLPEGSDPSLYALGKSLEVMSKCDAVVMAPGWKNARGCLIELSVAAAYGKAIYYMGDI